MLVEGLIYCLQSRLKLRTPEGSITAGGCSFNSFLRRTVRFVGMITASHTHAQTTHIHTNNTAAPESASHLTSLSTPVHLSGVNSPVCLSAGVHVFGLCATALVTDIIQLSTGHHAPFFLTVCKPNYTLAGISCDTNAYITKDICSGHDQHAIMAAR